MMEGSGAKVAPEDSANSPSVEGGSRSAAEIVASDTQNGPKFNSASSFEDARTGTENDLPAKSVPWYKKKLKDSQYNPRSLFCLNISNPLRRGIIRLVEWPLFDQVILAVIFINCGFLAAYDPIDTAELNPDSQRRAVLEDASLAFTIIFTIECGLKVLAYGLYFGHNAYLQDSWNWLDFGIVVIGIVDFLPGGGSSNLSALRTFRVMRPLRAITRFEELRFLVMLLLQCIPMLMNVIGLCTFIFFVFGILGVQLWSGKLRQRCYSQVDGSILDPDFVCGPAGFAFHECPTNYSCVQMHENPNFGITNFDSIGYAILTIFQVMTYEGWTEIMYFVQDAYSFWVVIYFFLLILIGPIFAIQLFLVVISNKFAETKASIDAAKVFTDPNAEKKKKLEEKPGLVRSMTARVLKKIGSSMSGSGSPKVAPTAVDVVQAKENINIFKRVQLKVAQFATSAQLQKFIIAVIIINTLFMALEHDCDLVEQSYCSKFKLSLEIANIIFTVIFGLEMFIKMAGLGLKGYLSDPYNFFDMVIVIISFVEFADVLSLAGCLASKQGVGLKSCTGGGSGLSVLRTFRLVRVVKLLRAFPALQRQIKIIVTTFNSVASLLVLIMLFLMIFSILGMNVFGGSTFGPVESGLMLGQHVLVSIPEVSHLRPARIRNISVEAVPYHYQVEFRFPVQVGNGTNIESMWTVGDGLCGPDTACPEDVPIISGVVPRANFDDLVHAIVTVFQILTQEDWPIVMFYATRSGSIWQCLYFVALIVVGNYILFNLMVAIIIQGFAENKEIMEAQEREDQMQFAGAQISSSDLKAAPNQPQVKRKTFWFWLEWLSEKMSSQLSKLGLTAETPRFEDGTPIPFEDPRAIQDKAFWLLPPSSNARKQCHWLMKHKYFDQFILFCILMSSVALAIQRPGVRGGEKAFLDWLNNLLNLIFLIECLVKVTALSFVIYIKTGWNKLDFFIVFTSIIDTSIEYATGGSSGFSALRILRIFRIFRALRPLRVISRARGLRIVVTTLTSSVKPILNTVVIAFGVFLIFGILGVQLFSGKLNYCTDAAIHRKEDCVGTNPLDGSTRSWNLRSRNFNNIGEALLTMFVLASQDNWPEHMWNGVDSTGKETGPIEDYAVGLLLYYIFFILVGGFFVLNIFVGVFVDNYNAATDHVDEEQENESTASSAAGDPDFNPNANQEKFTTVLENGNYVARINVRNVVSHTFFDLGIALCIVLNVITMAFESYKQSAWQNEFLVVTNYFFSFVFGAECFLKILAYTPRLYFMDNWNRFDFFIVMISFIGIAVDESGASLALNPTILRVLRVFRIFRILRAFRIFKAAKGLQAIVETLGNSLPAIGNLSGLLMLLFFIYGILGVELYGNLCRDNDDTMRCKMVPADNLLDSHASFINLGMALLTLFRIATNDNWGNVMQAAQLAGLKRVDGYMDTVKGLLEDAKCDFGRAEGADDGGCNYQLMQDLLPGCVSEGELLDLKVPCGPDGDEFCSTTCGNFYVSPLFFSSFVCVATFVLLNLVIAVLMQQLSEAESNAGSEPQYLTARLLRSTFGRIVWRWRRNARIVSKRKAGRFSVKEVPKVSTPVPDSGQSPPDKSTSELTKLPPVSPLSASRQASANGEDSSGSEPSSARKRVVLEPLTSSPTASPQNVAAA